MIFFPVAIRMGFGNEELMAAVVMRCSPTTVTSCVNGKGIRMRGCFRRLL